VVQSVRYGFHLELKKELSLIKPVANQGMQRKRGANLSLFFGAHKPRSADARRCAPMNIRMAMLSWRGFHSAVFTKRSGVV